MSISTRSSIVRNCLMRFDGVMMSVFRDVRIDIFPSLATEYFRSYMRRAYCTSNSFSSIQLLPDRFVPGFQPAEVRMSECFAAPVQVMSMINGYTKNEEFIAFHELKRRFLLSSERVKWKAKLCISERVKTTSGLIPLILSCAEISFNLIEKLCF
jgi:hypothetical protein